MTVLYEHFSADYIAQCDHFGWPKETAKRQYPYTMPQKYPGFDVKPGDIVLDAGACIGAVAIRALAKGAQKVVCVEPNPSNAALLRESLTQFPEDKYEIIEKAVTATSGDEVMLTDRFWRSTVHKDGELSVTTVGLQDLLDKYHPTMVKIDTEGSEIPTLLRQYNWHATERLCFEYTIKENAIERNTVPPIQAIRDNLEAKGFDCSGFLEKKMRSVKAQQLGRAVDPVFFCTRQPPRQARPAAAAAAAAAEPVDGKPAITLSIRAADKARVPPLVKHLRERFAGLTICTTDVTQSVALQQRYDELLRGTYRGMPSTAVDYSQADGRSVQIWCEDSQIEGINEYLARWNAKGGVDNLTHQFVCNRREDAARLPQFPVYIISCGASKPGASARLDTARRLDEAGVPYYIVVEPDEADFYESEDQGLRGKVLRLPADFRTEFGTNDVAEGVHQGGIPARNFVWHHAEQAGATRHWILDDNIQKFCRQYDNKRYRVRDCGVILRAIEDCAERHSNVALAGPDDEKFAIPYLTVPVLKNSRVYSCILIKTDVLPSGQRWRGVYNEDTDLFLRLAKQGHGTLLFKSLLMKKHKTQHIAGGNTDTVYGSDQDRRQFAESLRAQHPEDVRVVKRYGRYHHDIITAPSVAWRQNDLKPLEDVWKKLPPSDDYNMVLQELEKRDAAPAAAAAASAAASAATRRGKKRTASSSAAAAPRARRRGSAVRYPVYIPSKGRPGGVKVAKALGDCKIDYKIVVEPAQYDAYKEIHGEDRLLRLNTRYKPLNSVRPIASRRCCAACAPPWQSRHPTTCRYSSRVDGVAAAFCHPGADHCLSSLRTTSWSSSLHVHVYRPVVCMRWDVRFGCKTLAVTFMGPHRTKSIDGCLPLTHVR